jgi:hypothetical protein
MESNAAGLVLRLALKTRFSDKGMGFDSSAFRQTMPRWCNGSTLKKGILIRIRAAIYFPLSMELSRFESWPRRLF